MNVGTKSVLFGVHCFFLHPIFVAMAWIKLYGFPFDPRIWVAFFVHDIGYFGKPNMDGPEGERHVVLGARIMEFLFGSEWGRFSLYHSRYYAKANNKPVSKLCFADKLSFVMTPRWLYLLQATASGEIAEYLNRAKTADSGQWQPEDWNNTWSGKIAWHKKLTDYMVRWVEAHKDGQTDTWTNRKRK